MSVLSATLMRFSYQDKQTLGYLTFHNQEDSRFFMLELPWKDNQRKVSCIPEGVYNVVPWTSPRFGKCFKVMSQGHTEVIGRSAVLIHRGNYHTDIEGCLLPGMAMADINKDGYHDVSQSTTACEMMLKIAPQGFTLYIDSPFILH